MINVLRHFSLPRTLCCTELSDGRLLVTGEGFIKVFSLDTYEELRDIPSEVNNWDSLVVPERNMIFVASEKGLFQYSLPKFNLVKVHDPTSYGLCLAYLKSKNRILFKNNSNLLSLNLETFTVTRFENEHDDNIYSIVSTLDEKYFFTTGWDKTLKKWSTDSWRVVKSVDLESEGRSLLLKADSNSIVLGMFNGSICEFSLDDLSLLRTVKVHTDWITKIIQLSSGDVLTCSYDGSVCFPFRDKVPIRISGGKINSIVELSDKTVACSCDDGLRIIPSPVFYDRSLLEKIDSISSSLDSIRNSTSDRKTQLISLLQHHLAQLLAPVKHQPDKFTGLTLSLLPDLKSIQRSHLYDGLAEKRRKIVTQNYSLEMMNSKSVIPESQAILTLFDRKLKLLGKICNVDNPIVGFKVQQVRKRNWVFTLDQEFVLSDTPEEKPATAYFSNGHLNCLISEGDPLTRPGYQSVLKINTSVKEVISLGHDGVVVTSDQTVYRLNFDTRTIIDQTNY